MPDGGTLTLRTRLEAGAWVAVEVEDTGVGIAPEAREKIFRIGFSDWRNGTKGSGLGLYVVRRNIENHGGHIEVSSTVGEGTNVAVYLPLQPQSLSASAASV
jgi:signal transduction histidine kinase